MIGTKIKQLRKEHNLTQEDLSKKLGIKQPQLNRWETGKLSPSLSTLKKLSQIFKISIDTLVFDDKDINKLNLKDKTILEKIKYIDKLNDSDKEMVVNLIASLAKKIA